MTPTQVGEPVAARQTSRIDSWVVTTGLATTRTGIAAASSSARSMRRAWSSTTRSTSAPYRCWLPVTNQTSRSASAFIESPRRQGHRPVPASRAIPGPRSAALECMHSSAATSRLGATGVTRHSPGVGAPACRAAAQRVDPPEARTEVARRGFFVVLARTEGFKPPRHDSVVTSHLGDAVAVRYNRVLPSGSNSAGRVSASQAWASHGRGLPRGHLSFPTQLCVALVQLSPRPIAPTVGGRIPQNRLRALARTPQEVHQLNYPPIESVGELVAQRAGIRLGEPLCQDSRPQAFDDPTSLDRPHRW